MYCHGELQHGERLCQVHYWTQNRRYCFKLINFPPNHGFLMFSATPLPHCPSKDHQTISDDKCTMCVDGLKELQVILKDKKMLDIIEAVTTLFCSNFPLPQVRFLIKLCWDSGNHHIPRNVSSPPPYGDTPFSASPWWSLTLLSTSTLLRLGMSTANVSRPRLALLLRKVREHHLESFNPLLSHFRMII